MRVAVLFLALVGCATEKDEGNEELLPVENDTDTEPEACEGTAPVLEEVTVTADRHVFEGDELPAIKLDASATDTDGDLHKMAMTYWWDDVVDGAVDTTAAGTESGYLLLDEDECATPAGGYRLFLAVDGGRFDFATDYEFAVVVYDAAGLVSNTVVASGTSPAE